MWSILASSLLDYFLKLLPGTTLHDEQQQGHWSTQTPTIIRNLLRLFDELVAMLKVFKNKQKTNERSVGSNTHEYLWSAFSTILI
jgi:hypothetical protein